MEWEQLLATLKQIEKDDPKLLKRKAMRLSAEEGLTFVNFAMLHDGKTVILIDDYDSFQGEDIIIEDE